MRLLGLIAKHNGIPPGQLRVLMFLISFRQQMRMSPTMRDVMGACDIVSTNGIECSYQSLERKGLIQRQVGRFNCGSKARAVLPTVRFIPADQLEAAASHRKPA